MEELREQIAEIIFSKRFPSPWLIWEKESGYGKKPYLETADKILSLPIPDLWIEKECPECEGEWMSNFPPCAYCDKGIVHIPATLGTIEKGDKLVWEK